MIIVHYEVYVLESRGWMLHARYPRQDREEALREAKELETTLKIRVKVVRETYYTDRNKFDEAEVYLSGQKVEIPTTGRARSESRSSPPARAAVKKPGSKVRKPAPAIPERRKSAPRSSGSGAGALLLKLTVIVLVALAVSLGAIRLVPDVVLFLYDHGFRIRPEIYGKLLFAIFVMVFLSVAVPLALRVLPRQSDLHRANVPARPPPPPRPPKAIEKSLNQMAREVAIELDQKARDEAAARALEAEPLPELEPLDPDPGPEPFPEPERPEPAAAPTRPALDMAAVTDEGMRFFNEAAAAVCTIVPKLDKLNLFALSLYMGGAVSSFGKRRGLDRAAQAKLLAQALTNAGTPANMAATFHEKLADYAREPRYAQLVSAGEESVGDWMDGNTIGAHKRLTTVIKDWNRPKDAKPKASIITVMFTDMVGSTDMTQEKGDVGAQEIVRRHNTIVRTALSQYNGHEVKHTGDGIMASFVSASQAVEASVYIQRAVFTHNKKMPDLELHLRIGLNAGEPIQEEDDLFGSTVQLAARVCAATDTDQILCTKAVKEMAQATGRGVSFLSAGEHALKGFKTKKTLFEVAWKPSGGA